MSTLKKPSRRTMPAMLKAKVAGTAAPAKALAGRAGNKSASVKQVGGTPSMRVVPPVARRGRLSLQQIKHAVAVALRGQTFEADA
jgi:hypothetical protein